MLIDCVNLLALITNHLLSLLACCKCYDSMKSNSNWPIVRFQVLPNSNYFVVQILIFDFFLSTCLMSVFFGLCLEDFWLHNFRWKPGTISNSSFAVFLVANCNSRLYLTCSNGCVFHDRLLKIKILQNRALVIDSFVMIFCREKTTNSTEIIVLAIWSHFEAIVRDFSWIDSMYKGTFCRITTSKGIEHCE